MNASLADWPDIHKNNLPQQIPDRDGQIQKALVVLSIFQASFRSWILRYVVYNPFLAHLLQGLC